MGRIATGWQLTKTSLSVLRKDKELLVFPLLSGLTMILVLAGFVAGIFFTTGLTALFQGNGWWVGAIALVAYYLVSFFVGIFFNAAIIGAAMIRLNGGNPTLSDGLRIARENLGRIFLWALFAATVAMILRAVQERVGIIGKIIVGLVGIAWSLATYFVVPVLVYERLGPWAAVKRSASIFKATWGETLVGEFSMGGIFLLAGLAGFLPLVIGLLIGGTVAIVVGALLMVVYWILLALVAAAANSILVAALYRFATTGKVSEEFQGLPMFSRASPPAYPPVA